MEAVKITSISGTAVPLRGDDIDTDRIIPARFLLCVSFEGLGEHAFEDDREQDPKHPFNQDRYKDASVLIAGENFGCGSSREHAPQSLQRWGIKAIVAKSFAEIFFGNCVSLGLPCVTLPAKDVDEAMKLVESDPATPVTVDIEKSMVSVGDTEYAAQIPTGPRNQFLDGSWNTLTVLGEAAEAIDAKCRELPFGEHY